VSRALDFDKEDREILFMAFIADCIRATEGEFYVDHGGNRIPMGQVEDYFMNWIASHLVSDLRKRIAEWGAAPLPKGVTQLH
jgi:hypothetical protein